MREPAVLGGGLEHGVFAADLVGKSGHGEFVFHAAQHVQIRQAGLDHDHVGAFGNVQRHFAQRLVAVGRIHLIDLFVAFAQAGGAAHGIAERAVEGAGVFGAVGHDAGVDVAGGFQRLAHRADAAIHHVAGRDDVRARCGMRQGLLHELGDGGVVEDVAAFIEQAVLAVAGVGV